MSRFFFAQKAFIFDETGRLLVVQKSPHDPHNPGKWEVPGGRMQFGEDTDEHVRREVNEEVGLSIVPGRPFYLWQWVLGRNTPDGVPWQIVAVARFCKANSDVLDFSGRAPDDYLGDARWCSLEELTNLDWIPNMLPVLEAMWNELGSHDIK